MVLGVSEQVLLDRRDPHVLTVGERQIESLDLVPVVVRHEDVGEPVDAQCLEMTEDGA